MRKMIFGLFMGILFISPLGQVAKAYSPSLSASWEGSNVRITINNAQPNSRVDVYYRNQDNQVWSVISGLGTTDGSGYFYNLANLGMNSGSNASIYAMVGSDQTTTVNLGGGSGCWGYNCNNNNNITFSQNNINLSVGQSQSVTIYSNNSYYSANYYISSNSNSNVVSANISGNTLNLYGQSSGGTSIIVCQSPGIYYVSGYGNCGTLSVVVGGGMVGNITFSNSNPSLSVGQSMSVTINTPYIYSGNYYVSSNSNSNVVSANISVRTLSLYGNSNGSSTITVCQSGGSSACGSLYVTVTGSTYNNITFSQSNVSLSAGQSQSVSIYSNNSYYSSSYYISSNSNSSAVRADISGSTLNLYGQNTGSASIVVCQSGYSSSCGTLYATVSGGSGSFYLSPSSVTINMGQSSAVTANFNSIYSGYLYLGSNGNSNVASVSFSGSTANVYGINPGSTTMNICYSGQCNNLYVTVNGNACYGSNCSGNLYFTTTSLPQPTVNQYYSQQLQASGGSGNYAYSINSGNLPAGLNLSSTGQIYGTPVSSNLASFTVRVNDSYNRSAVASLTLTPTGGSVLGTSIYANGTLIQENGTVYIVYKNTKTGFASAWAFRGLGFSFFQVPNVSTSGLADSGYTVNSAYSSHPWGSWVKSGRTVYFVYEQGLIPVPSGDVFLNNGGSWNLVVDANRYDFERPILLIMDVKDARLE